MFYQKRDLHYVFKGTEEMQTIQTVIIELNNSFQCIFYHFSNDSNNVFLSENIKKLLCGHQTLKHSSLRINFVSFHSIFYLFFT